MDLSPDQKLAGILTPLFALRGENDLGAGDVAALRELIDWAADNGFGVVQLLPINETGNDNSPYNAISSVALDPITIEVSSAAIPDLSKEDLQHVLRGIDLAVLRQGPVKYQEVKALKRNLLRRAYESFLAREWKQNAPRARDFREFMRTEQPWLDGYASFRVLMETERAGEQWDLWPEDRRTFAAAESWIAQQAPGKRWDFYNEMRFFMYIQWIAFGQWRAVREYAETRGVALMGDVPFGVSYYSADVFTSPEIFDMHWSSGAPPEPYFRDDPFTVKWGQNWGMPVYRWDLLASRDLDWWRRRVRKVREVFHLFRIDHILGFYRIYAFPWRPQRNAEFLPLTEEEAREQTGGELPRFLDFDDETPEHCDANRRNGETRLKPLIEEVGEHRLIGEDLGTVPRYVRPSLLSLRIAGFKVPQWETPWGETRLIPGHEYDRLSVATYATHDHDPLRVQWERWMQIIEIAETDRSEDAAKARDHAWWEVRRLAGWADFEVPCITPFDGAVHEKLLEGLFRCNSWLAICMITDLFGAAQRFNIPGAVAESNWSERLAEPVRAWSHDPALQQRLVSLHRILAETGRIPPHSAPALH